MRKLYEKFRQNWLLPRLRGTVQGATAIEYGLIAALIGIAIVTAASQVKPIFNDIYASLTKAEAPAAPEKK